MEVLGQGMRALLLLVTSLGLALGLATTTIYDHPAESSSVEAFCLTLAAEQAAPPTVLPVGDTTVAGDLGDVAVAVLSVVTVVLAILWGRNRLPLLLRRAVPGARGAGVTLPVDGRERRGPSRPLHLTLSVIRI